MKHIEIPLVSERDRVYRWYERLPGILSWLTLLFPIILSIISPTLAAYFIIAYLLIWAVKAIALNIRVVQGYRRLNQHMSYEWLKLIDELDNPERAFRQYEQGISPKWHARNLVAIQARDKADRLYQKDILNAVIIAVYNESRDIIEPTIRSILKTDYNHKNMIVLIAYEERGGSEVEATVQSLADEFRHHFHTFEAVKHPKDLPNEVIGKGGNITYAGRYLKNLLDTQAIPYKKRYRNYTRCR